MEKTDKKIISPKIKKIIIWSLVGLFSAIVLFLITTLVVDKICDSKERKILAENGYINSVSVGDYSLNVLSFGKEDGKHTIVAIAGLGVFDLPITMRQMTSEIEKENRVVFVDRAGYGMSDDNRKDQTNEQIVSDYRTALKNANILPPYILMPHSIGGAYATYWESNYPDEIEAVMFIDGSQLSADAFNDEDNDSDNDFLDIVDFFGLQRLVFRSYNYLLPDNYSAEEQKISDMLSVNSMCSHAYNSECGNIAKNAQEAFNGIVTNDIKKIYISSSWGQSTREEVRESLAWLRRQQEKNNLPVSSVTITDEMIDKLLDDLAELRETELKPYIEKLGNCELKLLGGDHMIYQQRPEECGDILMEFLSGLD